MEFPLDRPGAPPQLLTLQGGRVSMGTGWGCADFAGGEGAVGRGQGWSPSLRAAGCAVILRPPDLPSFSECSK